MLGVGETAPYPRVLVTLAGDRVQSPAVPGSRRPPLALLALGLGMVHRHKRQNMPVHKLNLLKTS